jgi:hypothetical protein
VNFAPVLRDCGGIKHEFVRRVYARRTHSAKPPACFFAGIGCARRRRTPVRAALASKSAIARPVPTRGPSKRRPTSWGSGAVCPYLLSRNFARKGRDGIGERSRAPVGTLKDCWRGERGARPRSRSDSSSITSTGPTTGTRRSVLMPLARERT